MILHLNGENEKTSILVSKEGKEWGGQKWSVETQEFPGDIHAVGASERQDG